MNQPCQSSPAAPSATASNLHADPLQLLCEGVLGDRYEEALLSWLSSTLGAVRVCPRGSLLDDLALELSTLARRFRKAMSESSTLPLSGDVMARVRRMVAAVEQVSEAARLKALDLGADD
jgi:hypothetical protein